MSKNRIGQWAAGGGSQNDQKFTTEIGIPEVAEHSFFGTTETPIDHFGPTIVTGEIEGNGQALKVYVGGYLGGWRLNGTEQFVEAFLQDGIKKSGVQLQLHKERAKAVDADTEEEIDDRCTMIFRLSKNGKPVSAAPLFTGVKSALSAMATVAASQHGEMPHTRGSSIEHTDFGAEEHSYTENKALSGTLGAMIKSLQSGTSIHPGLAVATGNLVRSLQTLEKTV